MEYWVWRERVYYADGGEVLRGCGGGGVSTGRERLGRGGERKGSGGDIIYID